jgi:hypothetical protein
MEQWQQHYCTTRSFSRAKQNKASSSTRIMHVWQTRQSMASRSQFVSASMTARYPMNQAKLWTQLLLGSEPSMRAYSRWLESNGGPQRQDTQISGYVFGLFSKRAMLCDDAQSPGWDTRSIRFSCEETWQWVPHCWEMTLQNKCCT